MPGPARSRLGQALFHRVNRALKLTHAGETLFRAADEAIALVDRVTERLAGTERTLAVTTTPALASTWLAPRMPRFARLHEGTDVRVFATNDRTDLAREHLDLAIQFVLRGRPRPMPSCSSITTKFPVCSPRLARAARPKLARHLREGLLCAPFGPECTVRVGGFHLVSAADADATGPASAFAKWLREEVRRDFAGAKSVPGLVPPAAHGGRSRA